MYNPNCLVWVLKSENYLNLFSILHLFVINILVIFLEQVRCLIEQLEARVYAFCPKLIYRIEIY